MITSCIFLLLCAFLITAFCSIILDASILEFFIILGMSFTLLLVFIHTDNQKHKENLVLEKKENVSISTSTSSTNVIYTPEGRKVAIIFE